MKLKSTLILLSLMPLASSIRAEPRPYRSAASTEVLRLAADRYPGAIRELGYRKDASALDLLRALAAEPMLAAKKPPHPAKREETLRRQKTARAARFALARLGDKQALDDFIAGLSEEDPRWRVACVKTLGEIGSEAAIPALIPLLDDNSTPSQAKADGRFRPLSDVVVDALAAIAPQAGRRIEAQWRQENARSLQELWKDWWRSTGRGQ